MVAVKNVTVSEEFFQGHFPGTPLMPGVLMIEALTQVATLLLLDRDTGRPTSRVHLRGVDNAKFRKQVVPGDRLRLEVILGEATGRIVRAKATAARRGPDRRRSRARAGRLARRRPHRSARQGPSRRRRSAKAPPSEAFAVVGPKVRLGRNCRVGVVGRDRRQHDDWRRDGDLPVRVHRPAAAGPEVQGRGHEARHRPAEHLPRVRHDSPRHRRRRRADDDRRSQPVHGLRARRARLPRRQRDHLRAARHAGRPRRRGGLREHQRRVRRAPVLPRRARTRSSAATRWSRRTRCRSRAPSAAGRRASTASTSSACVRRGFTDEHV